MYNDYEYDYNYSNKKISLKNMTLKTKLVLFGIVIIALIIGLIIANNIKNYHNSYPYFEKVMVEKAQKYIRNQNIVVKDEIYIDIDKLGMTPKNGCSQISGVFVDADEQYTAYLSCDDYETKILNNEINDIAVSGKEIVLLAKGIPYIEQGINTDSEYKISGEVGTEEGVYNVNYHVIESTKVTTLTRKIVIVDNSYVKSLYPTIILNGDKIVYVKKGEKYQEKGVVASDRVDLNITNRIKTEGEVNYNQEGEYDLTYTVTNSRGYTNIISRKVVVYNNFSTTVVTALINPTTQTNQDITITLNVIGNNYSHMVLPDNRI